MTLRKMGILLWMMCSLGSLTAFGGGSSSSGGDGVIVNGVPYLLDFVEGDIHENPFLKDPSQYSRAVASQIERSLGIESQTAQLVAAKLMEVHQKSAYFELLLKWRMLRMEWMIIPEELINVKDEDGVIDFQGKELVQLAVRQGSQVFINKNHWQQMNAINQAGLILHEVIYSLYESFNGGNNHSPSVRAVTRTLFHSRFDSMIGEKFQFTLNRESFKLVVPLFSGVLKNIVFVRRNFESGFQLNFKDSYVFTSYPTKEDNKFIYQSHMELLSSVVRGNFVFGTSSPFSMDPPEVEQILSNQHREYRVYSVDHIL